MAKNKMPPPIERPGEHGLQTKPPPADAVTRLYHLMGQTTDMALPRLLGEVCDEIVKLRSEQGVEAPPAKDKKRPDKK